MNFLNLKKRKYPYIIAELSANHNQKLQNVYKLIAAAKKAGCDAIKIQTYKADKMTLNIKNRNFQIKEKKSPWYKSYLYDLYKQGETPREWHAKIFQYSKKKKILAFSSPFDTDSVSFLESINCPIYKIASFEITNYLLIEKIAKTKKPVIISIGMSNIKEIKKCLKYFTGNKNVAILFCNSLYPAKNNEMNLITIKDLSRRFKNKIIGFSDHTLGIEASLLAATYGAKIIEKHFSLKNVKGLDYDFSIHEKQMGNMVQSIRNIIDMNGKKFYGPSPFEKVNLKYRRSLYAIRDINKNELLNPQNVDLLRPFNKFGLNDMKKVIYKKAKKNISRGSVIKKNYY